MDEPKFEIGDRVYCEPSGDPGDYANGSKVVYGEVRQRYIEQNRWWYNVYIGSGQMLSWRREDRMMSEDEWRLVENTRGI